MRHKRALSTRIPARLAGGEGEGAKRGRKFRHVDAAAVTRGENGTKMTAPECRHGSMTGERFELWFETILLKNVKPGCAIIMDKAGSHRKKRLKEICGKAQVNLMFLPAYPPDFNPIEKHRANMKNALRDAAPLCDLLQTATYDYWR
jgi:transposase